MKLARWYPGQYEKDVFDALEGVFNQDCNPDWFLKPVHQSKPGFVPALDLEETDDAYVAWVELPGMKRDDIKIDLTNNVLTIQGERKHEMEEKKEGWHLVERTYGKFYRAVRIQGGTVDSENIRASYKDGILEVTLPKSKESKPKQIPVEIN